VIAGEVGAHRVAARGIQLEASPGNAFCHHAGRGQRHHLVLPAGQDEGRDRDLPEPIGDEGGRIEGRPQLTDEALRGRRVRLEVRLDRECLSVHRAGGLELERQVGEEIGPLAPLRQVEPLGHAADHR
jgi:hypothetical protein